MGKSPRRLCNVSDYGFNFFPPPHAGGGCAQSAPVGASISSLRASQPPPPRLRAVPLHRAYARSPSTALVRGRMLTRRQENRAAFAETDARIILFGAKAFEDDLVAVLDEAALLTGRQRDRLAPARGKLKKAAPAFLLRPGHGAGADEIAGDKIAAVAGVMRDHLRHGPIRRRERGTGEPLRRRAGAPHGFGRKVGFERDVEAAMRLVVGIGEIRQRRRIALRPRESGGAERRQRLP